MKLTTAEESLAWIASEHERRKPICVP
jgi:hypothetical protein